VDRGKRVSVRITATRPGYHALTVSTRSITVAS
jgi:hypothetical protein